MSYTKDKQFISKMFDEISPSYDRMNHLMSCGQDLRWRKLAVKYIQTLNGKYEHILDLAAGSGDFGREFLKLKPVKMFSADISPGMLKINREKVNHKVNNPIITDAEKLPFRDNYIDLCGIAFGIRNFENLERCIQEINRVLKPGGYLFVIEMFKPHSNNLFDKSFKLYFNKFVPLVGKLMSRSKYAYNYLHYSVENFLTVDSFINLAEEIGFNVIFRQKNFSDIVYSVCFKKKIMNSL